MLELKSLSHAYGPQVLFQDLNLVVPSQGFIAIRGVSGVGKTTLLSFMAGLRQPDAGQVLFSGQDFVRATAEERAHLLGTKLSVLPQKPYLFPRMRVWENAALPLFLQNISRETAKPQALTSLREVGLESQAEQLASSLSGGQIQRVALAQAIIRPELELLFVDEPTSNLDDETSAQMISLLTQVWQARKLTVVAVTHDTHLLRAAQKVYTLSNHTLIPSSL